MPSYHPDERLPAQIYCLSLASAMAALHLIPIIQSPLLAWRMLNTSAPSLLIFPPPSPLLLALQTTAGRRRCFASGSSLESRYGSAILVVAVAFLHVATADVTAALRTPTAMLIQGPVWLNFESTGAFIRTDSKQITLLPPRNNIAWR